MISLKEIFKKHNCDKAIRHCYHEVYEKVLSPHRDKKTFRLLEVGILRGESTRAWLEYLHAAKTITCIDTFERVGENDLEDIMMNERIVALKCDSTSNEMTREVLGNLKPFDCIIDDGLHTPKANGETFANLFPLLKKGGVYIIEDVWPLDIMTQQEMNHHWIKKHPHLYTKHSFDEDFLTVIEEHSGFIQLVERIDFRSRTGNPDSYIFKITKKGNTLS